MSRAYITQIAQSAIKKGMALGMEQGVESERALLRRLVIRRFDQVDRERFSDRLKSIDDTEQLANIGEWIIESETADILFQKMDDLQG